VKNVSAPDAGVESYEVEAYWDDLTGKSWMFSDGNPAALKYAVRSGVAGLPLDNEVLYGTIGAFGHLVHVSEVID
jgi:hypothetical protein